MEWAFSFYNTELCHIHTLKEAVGRMFFSKLLEVSDMTQVIGSTAC